MTEDLTAESSQVLNCLLRLNNYSPSKASVISSNATFDANQTLRLKVTYNLRLLSFARVYVLN